MARTLRFSLLCLVVTAFACADSDRAQIERLDLGVTGNGNFTLQGLTLSTSEDTPVSGIAVVQGYRGQLTTSIVQQGTLGALVFSGGTRFTYTPQANATGTDTVIVAVTDETTTLDATISITITAVNDPPALTGATTLTMAEDTSLTLSLANVSVVDPDSPASALALTLLPSVEYQSTGNTLRPPLNFNGDLAVYVLLSDGQTTATVKLTVTVTPVNDAPFETVPPPQRTDLNTPFAFGSSASVHVSDVDSGNAPLLVELSADNGTITLASTVNLAFTTGDGVDDQILHFSGSQAAVNAALNGMSVTPPNAFDGLITLRFYTNDQGATGAGGPLSDSETFVLGVGPVDLPPFATLPPDFNLDEDTQFIFRVSGAAVTVGDPDLPDGDTMSVNIGVSTGALTLSEVSGLDFTLGNGTSDAQMAFTGTTDDINAAFDGMIYTPSLDYAGPVQLTLGVQSGEESGSNTLGITMNAINDAPSITPLLTTVSTFANTAFAFTDTAAVTVGDVDASDGNVTMTITSTHGTVAMTAASGAIIDAVSTPTSIVAEGVVDALASSIATLVFTPDTDYTGAASVTIDVDDNGNTGAGGPLDTRLIITVNVLVPHMPPIAGDDSYDTMGNTELGAATSVGIMTSVLANDSDADGPVTLVTLGTITTALDGTVTLADDGTFTYEPPVGVGGASAVPDTFQYTIADSDDNEVSATVTINLHQLIWYVDNTSTLPVQDGRSSSPFLDVASAANHAGPGTTIYVAASAAPYIGNVELEPEVTLLGSGVALTRLPYNPNINPTVPTSILNDGSSANITASIGCVIRGVNLTAGTPVLWPAITMDTGTGLTIDSVLIQQHSVGIVIQDVDGTVTISRVNILNATNQGIIINADTDVMVNISNTSIAHTQDGILASTANNAALSLAADTLTLNNISAVGISFDNESFTNTSVITITNGVFNDQPDPTGASLGTTAIDLSTSQLGGTTRLMLGVNQFSGWSQTGIDLHSGVTTGGQTTALFALNTFANTTGDAFTVAAIAAAPTGTGKIDVTVLDSIVGGAAGEGLLAAPTGGAFVCLDLSGNFFTGSTGTGYDFNASNGFISLSGYDGSDLSTYLGSQGDFGSSTSSGSSLLGSSCMSFTP